MQWTNFRNLCRKFKLVRNKYGSFQQDSATTHTAHNSMAALCKILEASHCGLLINPIWWRDYFLSGYLKKFIKTLHTHTNSSNNDGNDKHSLKEIVWGAVPWLSAKELPKCFNITFTTYHECLKVVRWQFLLQDVRSYTMQNANVNFMSWSCIMWYTLYKTWSHHEIMFLVRIIYKTAHNKEKEMIYLGMLFLGSSLSFAKPPNK
jgi:hypothetical protein